jgi:hypothetical protein
MKQSGKTGQNADSVAIGRASKDVIINETKVRMAAHNVRISKNLLSHHLVKFQEQESLTDFEYTARHVAKKIFSATRDLNWLSPSRKLHKVL